MEDSIYTLESHFQKAETDLQYVTHKLEREYAEKCKHGGVNPLRLLQRLKAIEEELPKIRSDCENIVAAKQDLIEACQALMSNQIALQKLQKRTELKLEGARSKAVHSEFSQMCYRWNKEACHFMTIPQNLRNGTGLLKSEDLNLELIRSTTSAPIQPTEPLSMADCQAFATKIKESKSQPIQEEQEQLSTMSHKESHTTIKKTVTIQLPPSKPTRSITEFHPVTEEEFAGVSELTRGRCKLAEVNKVYETIFQHYSRTEGNLKRKTQLTPLSIPQLVNLGCKITGQTGEAKLSTLRALKLIDMNKQGVVIRFN